MKQIPNYPHHEINEDGTMIANNLPNARVKYLSVSEQVIKGKGTDYLYATLVKLGVHSKRIAVHRLVAITYIPNPDNLPEVNHLDRNRRNNHYSNLEWCTHQQNMQHAANNGRIFISGEQHWNFGKPVSPQAKILMSAAKLGANHPKYKGYYVINGKKFDSACQAAKHFNTDAHTVIRRCKNPKWSKEYTFVPKSS